MYSTLLTSIVKRFSSLLTLQQAEYITLARGGASVLKNSSEPSNSKNNIQNAVQDDSKLVANDIKQPEKDKNASLTEKIVELIFGLSELEKKGKFIFIPSGGIRYFDNQPVASNTTNIDLENAQKVPNIVTTKVHAGESVASNAVNMKVERDFATMVAIEALGKK